LLLVEVFFLWGKFDLFYVFPPGTIFWHSLHFFYQIPR
jgi:hypothetical protein